MARTSSELTSTEIAIIESLDPLGAPGTVPTVNAGGNGFDYTTAGAGDVVKVGTPVNNQVAVWTGDGTVEGDTALTFDTATDTLTSGVFNSSSTTASELLATDASKNIVSLPVATYPSLAETAYVKGVTSAIQTQLNGKSTTALDNLASVAINTSLVSDTDNTDDLGTTAKKWANLFITTIGATATRVTKGWFTDLEVTNMPTVGGTAILSSLTAPQFTTLELGHATDTTFGRSAAGVGNIEGEIINGFTSTATAAGTTTMDNTYTKIQQFTGTTTQTLKLPTTGIVKGQQYIVHNIGTSIGAVVTVQSSGANTILILGYGCTGIFTSTQATPTSAAHWTFQKIGKNVITAVSYTTDTGTSLNCDYWDTFVVTAQAGAIKLNNPTGTPKIGQLLKVSITGTAARAVTYDTQFLASTVALPDTTVTTAQLNMIFEWNGTSWVILGAV